jgi:soluble lytic murein transglycosylase-like protein
MKLTQWAIIPGVLCSCLILIFLTGLISQPSLEASAANNTTSSSQPSGDCTLKPSYPASVRQWCALIQHHATEQNLDPNLVAAVILEESGGDSQAYSKSGAVGLMQVMPNDGIASSFTCGDHPCFTNRPNTSQLLDPEFNIEYGTRLLNSLVQRNGNLRDALKAYGPIDVGYSYADAVISILTHYQ